MSADSAGDPFDMWFGGPGWMAFVAEISVRLAPCIGSLRPPRVCFQARGFLAFLQVQVSQGDASYLEYVVTSQQ